MRCLEIEGLKLENEVFRNYLERQIHDQPDAEEVPAEGKKVTNGANWPLQIHV